MNAAFRFRLQALALAPMLLAGARAPAAEIALYPTGPAEDSAFVRFVNGGAQTLQVRASGGKAAVTLTTARPASDFLPVAAGKPIEGTLSAADAAAPVSLSVKPGEFATVVGWSQPKGAPATTVIKESPDDFNAMRASVAIYNVDSACAKAGLRTAGANHVPIFDDVGPGQVKRRLINPTSLTVELTCGGAPQGGPIALGALEAGKRYSVFAVPGAQGARGVFAADTLAH